MQFGYWAVDYQMRVLSVIRRLKLRKPCGVEKDVNEIPSNLLNPFVVPTQRNPWQSWARAVITLEASPWLWVYTRRGRICDGAFGAVRRTSMTLHRVRKGDMVG